MPPSRAASAPRLSGGRAGAAGLPSQRAGWQRRAVAQSRALPPCPGSRDLSQQAETKPDKFQKVSKSRRQNPRASPGSGKALCRPTLEAFRLRFPNALVQKFTLGFLFFAQQEGDFNPTKAARRTRVLSAAAARKAGRGVSRGCPSNPPRPRFSPPQGCSLPFAARRPARIIRASSAGREEPAKLEEGPEPRPTAANAIFTAAERRWKLLRMSCFVPSGCGRGGCPGWGGCGGPP